MGKRMIIIIQALVIGIVVTIIGAYNTFFAGKGYIETTAVIDHIDEIEIGLDENDVMQYDYEVYVNYNVDGKDYSEKTDYYAGNYKEGMEIKIFYNPDDPAQIHGDNGTFGIVMMIGGAVITVICIVLLVAVGMVMRKNN